MAHSISVQKQYRMQLEAEWHDKRRTAPQRRRAIREAQIAIAAFNVRAQSKVCPALAWPTFRCAELAKRYFLRVLCPSCSQVASIDLREIYAHPDTSINSLTPHLKCLRCQPNPPLACIVGLRKWKF